jgi:MFS family permease
MVMFLVHGLVVSTWVSRIPAVQAKLGLTNGVLGATLLGTACGSVLAIPPCGWLVARFGSRKVTAWSTLGFCFSLIPISFASNAAELAAALFVFGAMGGAMDVAMNVQGVEIEKGLGKPTMSRFHAMFSIGGMAGAGWGGALAARGVGPPVHFAVAASLYSALAGVFVAGMIALSPRAVARQAHRLPLAKIPAGLLAASAIAFCMLLCEGAMADWTAVYLRQTLAAGQGTAAAGYSVFSAAMAVFRLLGDAITLRLGNARTARFGSLLAAGGVFCAISAPSARWALPGFAAAGAGFSVMVPLAFGAGGRIEGVNPGAGVATVTGLGYIGFLIGPPLIGFTAQALTLRAALGIVVLFCLAAAALAGWVRDETG